MGESETRHPERYYGESGSVPVLGALITILLGCVGGVALALLYSLAVRFLPSYMRWLPALLLGAFTGVCTMYAGRLGKIRSRKFRIAAGVVAAVPALYAAWAFHLTVSPGSVLTAMKALAENPGWTVAGREPTLLLAYVVWFLEAVLVVVAAVIFAALNRKAFCERCGHWAKKHADVTRLQAFSPILLRAALEGRNYDGLTAIPKAPPDSVEYVSIDLELCGDECERSLLTAWQVTAERGRSRGPIVRRIVIPAAVALDLIAHGMGEAPASADLPEEDASDTSPGGYGGLYDRG